MKILLFYILNKIQKWQKQLFVRCKQNVINYIDLSLETFIKSLENSFYWI